MWLICREARRAIMRVAYFHFLAFHLSTHLNANFVATPFDPLPDDNPLNEERTQFRQTTCLTSQQYTMKSSENSCESVDSLDSLVVIKERSNRGR